MVVFAPERVFVPFHRALQRFQSVSGHIAFARLDKDIQFDLASQTGHKAVLPPVQIARDNGVQVARFRHGVEKHRFVPSVGQVCGFFLVAVGNQSRKIGFIGNQRRAPDGHHVGAVRKVGNAAETVGFTLGTQDSVRRVKSLQFGVCRGVEKRFDGQRKVFGRIENRQTVVGQRVFAAA